MSPKLTLLSIVLHVFSGNSCEKIVGHLIRKMTDSFEGGVFRFYWDTITGGGIGFGCGALLPYAHGKTMYFNECGLRQMLTVEMDLRKARWVFCEEYLKSKEIDKNNYCTMYV